MKRFVYGMLAAVVAFVATAVATVPAASAATVTTKWDTQAIVKMTLTPNYYTGYGQVKAVFGTQPTPTHGAYANAVGQGAVDFGNIEAGVDYLYKYAAHVNVTTNDPGGFQLYGEGVADFTGTAGGASPATIPLSTVLFYANSTSGSPADTNTGFSPGFPFYKTSAGSVSNPGLTNGSGTATINYGGSYPSSPIATSATPTADFYYDYLLKVPLSVTVSSQYYVWIVYTVVAS